MPNKYIDNTSKQIKLRDINNELASLYFKRSIFPREYQLKVTSLNARIVRLLDEKKKLQNTPSY